MHELQITESILQVVLDHASSNEVRRVVRIHLAIGELSDLEAEWIQHYFDYLSRGTLAQGAELVISHAPIVARCRDCDDSARLSREQVHTAVCNHCGGSDLQLLSGREYTVENMEVL